MKFTLAGVLLALVVDGAAAQRFPGVDCMTLNCTQADASATCDSFTYLAGPGNRCSATSQDKLLSDAAADTHACAELASADADCSAVFLYSESTSRCECHRASASPCVIVGAGSRDTAVLALREMEPFCSCSAATDSSVYNGGLCDHPKDTHVEFAETLNVLNDVANNGLLLQSSISSASTVGDNFFNHIELASPAELLDRGFDGSITLNLLLFGEILGSSISFDDIHTHVITGMVRSLAAEGVNKRAGNFAPLSREIPELGTSDLLNTSCVCPEALAVGEVCQTNCTLVIVEYLVLEQTALEIWEISLIIIAGVLLVCALAIALSFTKSEATKKAEAAEKMAKANAGKSAQVEVEMTKR